MRRARRRRWVELGSALLAASLCLACTCERDDVTSVVTSAPAATQTAAAGQPHVPAYVGRQTCASCHQKEHTAWQGSHHDLAMQEPSPKTILGDFSGARFAHSGESFEFSVSEGRYTVRVTRSGEKPRTLDVKYTFGVAPLQQYLVDVGRGALQALTVAWDARPKAQGGQRWFHLHAGEKVPVGDPLHWEGPQYNWNSMCADCHSTGVGRGYDRERETYHTTFEEIDVSCETCHGPGSQHVAWARAPKKDSALTTRGLAVDLHVPESRHWVVAPGARIAHLEGAHLEGASSAGQPEACAPCHSRRADLGPGHGTSFHDRYRLSLLSEPLYYPDGQQREEVFVYGSFLQSKMYARGVICSDCHEPHSQKLWAEGNALCATCHSGAAYDTVEHHFHEAGTPGAACTSCHMPETTYMGVDARSDHAFKIPSPALSEKIGAPDACTSCHTGKSAAWAEESIRRHRPAGGPKGETVTLAFWRARQGQLGAEAALRAVATNDLLPAITRATALEELSAFPSPRLLDLSRSLVISSEPLLRRGAIEASAGFPPAERARVLARLLTDPVRSVRSEAAQNLLDAPPGALDQAALRKLDPALAEYVATQTWSPDRAETLVNLADLSRRTGNVVEAEKSLRSALSRDPTFSAAYLNLADLQRQEGQDEAALKVLQDGLARAADPALLQHSLGLTLVRLGKRDEALRALSAAYASSPTRTQFGYVYAVALFDSGERERAIGILVDLTERRPGDVQVLQTLIGYLAQDGQTERAREYGARFGEFGTGQR